MLSTPEKAFSSEKSPIFVDLLLEAFAFGKADVPQENDSQKEQYLLDSILKRLRVHLDFGKIYQVKDRQQQRYAVHIPQAGGQILYRSRKIILNIPATLLHSISPKLGTNPHVSCYSHSDKLA